MNTFADRRPIAPSLLSDPAFSADPYSHPYAVTNHEPWLVSPPAGHPSLKSETKRGRNRFLASARAIDSDPEPFPLIQPPNSPVSFGNTDNPPTVASPKDAFIPTKSKEPALSMSLQSPRSPNLEPQPSAKQSHQLSPQPPPPVSNPPKKERTLMTFLKRRSSQQPESSSAVVNSKPKKPSTLSKETRAAPDANDVTRPSVHRQQTEPNNHNVNRPTLPERPATLGATMPGATSLPPSPLAKGSSAANLKRRVTDIPAGRVQDLDRIDELDETNPWGIALHHGGPYEAAVQAIRKKDAQVFPGYGSYHRGVPQPSDNKYAPPQAVGLSLNLLPGQILPRNIYAYKPPLPTAVMMRPGAAQTVAPPTLSPLLGVTPSMQSSASLPLSSRPHSYQPSPAPGRDHQPRRQSYASMTPLVTLSVPPTAPTNPLPPQPQVSPTAFPQMQNAPASPHNQPISAQPNRKPPNQEIDDRVTQPRPGLDSIGIGMAMFEEDSDEDSESPASELPTTRNVPSSKTPETKDEQLRKPSPLKISQPDQASSSESVESRVVASTSTTKEPPSIEQSVTRPSAMQSPPPYASPTSGIYSAEYQRSQLSVPSQPCSKVSLKPSSQTENMSHVALHVTVEAEVIHQAAISQPSFTPKSNLGSDTSLHMPRAPRTERVQYEDTGSTHPSVSTQSSSQSRSSMGPPPSRHVPKRLVMPAPLGRYNSLPSSPQSRLPLPQAQTRPPRAPKPPPRVMPRVPVPVSSPVPASSEAMLPAVKAQAKEIRFSASRVSKLKKRVSLITASTTPSAPIVTTVSFAPPVIEFESPDAAENKFHRVMAETFIPKGVLSKRRFN